MEIEVKQFCFYNSNGGTGMSCGMLKDEVFSGTARVRMVKGWHDYETGYRFIGEAISADINAYLDRNAKPDDRRVFFSEFELADRRDLGPLIDAIPQEEDA